MSVNIHLVFCPVLDHYTLLITDQVIGFCNINLCIYTLCVNIHLVFCPVLALYTLLFTFQGGGSVIESYVSTHCVLISI